jgi:phenylalanyl-tRNA synthetase beta chain
LEVGEVIATGRDWDGVFVGMVQETQRHPNADRLVLATVDLGDGPPQRVVCGAPNVAAGQKVAFAREGAVLIDGHTGQPAALRRATIRGVESAGMICSEKELGLSNSHEGILVLPEDAPVGTPLASSLGDVIFDFDLRPNRPDCLSVMGIAREVAALTGRLPQEPPIDYEEVGPPVRGRASVEIVDSDLCPRYCAGLIEGVQVGSSPAWMQERLAAAGVRPINNVVDVTNYVMLELGQPLHAFDFSKIGGQRIVVRRPRHGESFLLLDGSQRQLSPEMLVIADAEKAVALAGIMGGADSEVDTMTTAVFLESANFDPGSIRHTAAALKLRTEASLRFEKGLGRELAMVAARRAARLLVEFCGGQAAGQKAGAAHHRCSGAPPQGSGHRSARAGGAASPDVPRLRLPLGAARQLCGARTVLADRHRHS